MCQVSFPEIFTAGSLRSLSIPFHDSCPLYFSRFLSFSFLVVFFGCCCFIFFCFFLLVFFFACCILHVFFRVFFSSRVFSFSCFFFSLSQCTLRIRATFILAFCSANRRSTSREFTELSTICSTSILSAALGSNGPITAGMAWNLSRSTRGPRAHECFT